MKSDMPPPLDSKRSWESTPTALLQTDPEKGDVEESPNVFVDEANGGDEDDGANPLPSLNSRNETDGDVSTELDSELIVWWDGPEDPENPMNWSSTWKWVNICVISLISFLV